MAEEVDVNVVQESSVKIPQKSANDKKKKPVCRFYARTGRCKFEEKCRFFHSNKGSADTSHANTKPDQLGMQDNKEEIVSQTTQQEANQTTQEEAKQTAQQEVKQTRLEEQTTPLEAKQTSQQEANENTQHEANEGKQDKTSGKTHPQDIALKTSQKVCKFYKSRGGCIRGSACRFSHVKPTATKIISSQDNNTSKPNTPKPDVHKEGQTKKVISTSEKLSLLGDEELNSLRTRELVQLVRRFGKNKATEVQDYGPGTTYNINFTPTDPDWPFDIECVLLAVTFPEEYPKKMFDAGLSKEQALPMELVRCVNQEIKKWTENQQITRSEKDTVDLPFRPFLRWLDRNLEKFFILAAKQMKESEENSVSEDNLSETTEGIESNANNEEESDSKSSEYDINNERPSRTSDTENVDPCNPNMSNRQKQYHQRKKTKHHAHSNPDRKDLLLSDFLVIKSKSPKIKVASNSKAHHHGDSSLDPKNEHIVFVSQESSELLTDRGLVDITYDTTHDDAMEHLSWGDAVADGEDDESQIPSEQSVPNERPRGTEIRLRGLELFENTSTLRTDTVALTMECDKCKTKFDTKADNTRTTAMRCERCTNVVKLGFRPSIIHQYSTCTLGYLDIQGCHPFDLVMADISLIAGCLACSNETPIKGAQYGSNQAWCSKCHQKLKFQVETARFFQLMPTSALSDTSDGHIPMPKRKPKAPGLKEGFPLPDKGTCKHYKKSYRWLRFPCCGKCYPCDVCHDEEESHEMKFATRMVCGFCSKEQPYSQCACTACGSATTRAKTSHWEGGKGCRNKTVMSKGDDQKFRNTRKTTSRKSQAKTTSGNTKPK